MSIAPDLDILESLDFSHTPQCEHSEHLDPTKPDHYGPAYVLVRVFCPCSARVVYLCRPWWESCLEGHILECACGRRGPARDFYTLVAYVNGAS